MPAHLVTTLAFSFAQAKCALKVSNYFPAIETP